MPNVDTGSRRRRGPSRLVHDLGRRASCSGCRSLTLDHDGSRGSLGHRTRCGLWRRRRGRTNFDLDRGHVRFAIGERFGLGLGVAWSALRAAGALAIGNGLGERRGLRLARVAIEIEIGAGRPLGRAGALFGDTLFHRTALARAGFFDLHRGCALTRRRHRNHCRSSSGGRAFRARSCLRRLSRGRCGCHHVARLLSVHRRFGATARRGCARLGRTDRRRRRGRACSSRRRRRSRDG